MGAIVRRLARRDRFPARRGRRSGEQAACLLGAPAPPVQPTSGSPSPGFFPGLSFGPCFRPSSSRSGSLLFSLSLCSAGCGSFTPVGSLFIVHSCTRLGHATASKTGTRPHQIPAIPTQHHAAVTKCRVLLRVSRILCKRVFVYFRDIRPSNWMAKRFRAVFQSLIGIDHFLLMLSSAR
jgi:hypothetical protein